MLHIEIQKPRVRERRGNSQMWEDQPGLYHLTHWDFILVYCVSWEPKSKFFPNNSHRVSLIFEARAFFKLGDCPASYRTFSSIPGLNSVDASGTPSPAVLRPLTTKMSPSIPWKGRAQNHPPWAQALGQNHSSPGKPSGPLCGSASSSGE